MLVEIAPCPFCGGVPVVGEHVSNYTSTGIFAFVSCFCGGHTTCAYKSGDSVESAISAWNIRNTKIYCVEVRHFDDYDHAYHVKSLHLSDVIADNECNVQRNLPKISARVVSHNLFI